MGRPGGGVSRRSPFGTMNGGLPADGGNVMLRLAIGLLVCAALAGCGATSKVTAFRDPAYQTTTYGRIGVFAVGTTLEAGVEIERMICAQVAPSPCVPGKSVLPPTRDYPADEVQSYLSRAGVDGVLIVALVADQSDTTYLGSTTFANAQASGTATTTGNLNLYGNSAYWSGTTVSNATASGQATTMPIYNFTRVAFGQLALFDRASGDVAWRGEIKVSGSGLINITDAAFIKSAAAKIATELKATQLVAP